MPSDVRPAEYQLDRPPESDEGHVVNVEHDTADPRFMSGARKECQSCGAAVDRREAHTTAFIRIQTSIGPQHKRPVFCGPDCWYEFATVGRRQE